VQEKCKERERCGPNTLARPLSGHMDGGGEAHRPLEREVPVGDMLCGAILVLCDAVLVLCGIVLVLCDAVTVL
jgi:hypothetical protein